MQDHLIALLIGTGLMWAGAIYLQKQDFRLRTRVLLGAAMAVASAVLAYPLVTSTGGLDANQVQFGLAMALGGLGINQMTAPLRAGFGRAL